jgi:hypothetical protein
MSQHGISHPCFLEICVCQKQHCSLLSVAYAAASIKGGKMEKQSLLSVGVRLNGIDDLVQTINEWIEETHSTTTSTTHEKTNPSQNQTTNHCPPMMILPDTAFQPTKAWDFATYKPNKKTGLASLAENTHKLSPCPPRMADPSKSTPSLVTLWMHCSVDDP